MNRYMQDKWSWVEGTHTQRLELLNTLSDADLAFTPGGTNMTLGALCRELGEIEHSYIESLKAFKQDWTYRNTEAGLDGSVARLKAWYQHMDDEMKSILTAFSDADLAKMIDRNGFSVPVDVQMDIYLQALLIFAGKASIFLRAMNRTLPGSMQDWIG